MKVELLMLPPADPNQPIHLWKQDLPEWQQSLVARLERDLRRTLAFADLACIDWNESAHTLTVQRIPLRTEIKSSNFISNVYRSRSPNRND